MTAKLTIVYTASPTEPKQRGIYNDLPIRGGERVDIHITTPIELALGSRGEFKMSLYVNNISGYVQEKGMETFTLHLISKEGLLNQNTRVIEKFVGKSTFAVGTGKPETVVLTLNTPPLESPSRPSEPETI